MRLLFARISLALDVLPNAPNLGPDDEDFSLLPVPPIDADACFDEEAFCFSSWLEGEVCPLLRAISSLRLWRRCWW
jgi:hypothetical protein